MIFRRKSAKCVDIRLMRIYNNSVCENRKKVEQ